MSSRTFTRKLADRINRSQRPVLLVGKGAVGAWQEIRDIMSNYGIPVCTSLHGLGIVDEGEDLALHMIGMHGSVYGNLALSDADLIVGIGVRFDDRTTGNTKLYGTRARKKFRESEGLEGGVIHVDISKNSVGKNITPDLHYIADANEICKLLLTKLEKIDRSEWHEKIGEWKKENPFDYHQGGDGLKIQEVISKMNTILGDRDYVLTTGVGNHQMMSAQFLKWRRPNRMITSGSLGTMGVGLPFAIGCALAHRDNEITDRDVYLIDGDGSFNMTYHDLKTVMEHNLPIKIFLMNDGRQQMVHVWQQLFFENRIRGTINCNPNYGKIAEAHDIAYLRCDNRNDLDDVLNQSINGIEGPLLVDFVVEPDYCLPLVSPGKGLHEMITLKSLKSLKEFNLTVSTADVPS